MPVPRCEAELNHAITSSEASRYACGEASDGLTQSLQLVQFQGRQCGYDLIRWERASILGPDSDVAQACEIKKQNLSLQCGETPDGEHLPGRCLPMREPAVFRLEKKFSGAKMGKTGSSSTEWLPVYVVKLFDTGMSAMGRYSAPYWPCVW